MKQNVKIAKELLKLAKELTAVNPDENFSDVTWAYINEMLDETEFIAALEKYLKLRSLFINALTADESESLLRIKGRLATILRNDYNDLNTKQLIEEIDDMIKTAREKLLSDSKSNNTSFQTYIESLVKTREVIIASTNKADVVKIQTKDSAEKLMSRISEIIHEDNLAKLNDQEAITANLQNLIQFLKSKKIELIREDSKQKGDKNLSENEITHINENKEKEQIRVRIDREAKTLKDALQKLNLSMENQSLSAKNMRFKLVRNICDDLTQNFTTVLGYMTTVNSNIISNLMKNRQNLGLVEIPHDIPQQENLQYTDINEIKINETKFNQLREEKRKNKRINLEQSDLRFFIDNYDKLNLTESQINALIKKFKERIKTGSINAGIIDNVKEFIRKPMTIIKNFFENFKQSFNNFISNLIPNQKIEQDIQKLDSIEINNDALKVIQDLDKTLMNFSNFISNK